MRTQLPAHLHLAGLGDSDWNPWTQTFDGQGAVDPWGNRVVDLQQQGSAEEPYFYYTAPEEQQRRATPEEVEAWERGVVHVVANAEGPELVFAGLGPNQRLMHSGNEQDFFGTMPGYGNWQSGQTIVIPEAALTPPEDVFVEVVPIAPWQPSAPIDTLAPTPTPAPEPINASPTPAPPAPSPAPSAPAPAPSTSAPPPYVPPVLVGPTYTEQLPIPTIRIIEETSQTTIKPPEVEKKANWLPWVLGAAALLSQQ